MIALITSLGAWSWIILGGILLVIEVITPGTFFLWLGVWSSMGLITVALVRPRNASADLAAGVVAGLLSAVASRATVTGYLSLDEVDAPPKTGIDDDARGSVCSAQMSA